MDPGKTYRLRLISAVSLDYLTFYVKDHNLTIIAADATPTEHLTVSSVDINSGQRFGSWKKGCISAASLSLSQP